MSNKYNYRLATHNDIKQLQQLGLISYGKFKLEITKENWEKWALSFESKSNFSNLLDIATCFVCEFENEIVGMAFFIPNGNPFLYFLSEWSYIRYVGVHPQHEGNGIGKN